MLSEGRPESRHVRFSAEGLSLWRLACCSMVASLIRRTRPHLVAFTGDIVDGRPFGSEHPATDFAEDEINHTLHPPLAGPGDAFGLFAAAFMRVLAPVLERGIPWTFCPGNHDDDGSPWTRTDLLRTFALPARHAGGDALITHRPLLGADADERAVRVWNFDSGANRPSIQKWPSPPSGAVRGVERAPARPCAELAFVHVPLPGCIRPIVAGTCGSRASAGMLGRPWR